MGSHSSSLRTRVPMSLRSHRAREETGRSSSNPSAVPPRGGDLGSVPCRRQQGGPSGRVTEGCVAPRTRAPLSRETTGAAPSSGALRGGRLPDKTRPQSDTVVNSSQTFHQPSPVAFGAGQGSQPALPRVRREGGRHSGAGAGLRDLGVTPTLVAVLVSDSSLGTVGAPVLPISAWRASGLQELAPRPPTTAALGALHLGAQI